MIQPSLQRHRSIYIIKRLSPLPVHRPLLFVQWSSYLDFHKISTLRLCPALLSTLRNQLLHIHSISSHRVSLRHPYRPYRHRLLLPPKIGARPPPTNPQPFHPSTGAGGFSRVSTSAGLLDWTELEPKTRPAISSASKAAASFRYLVSCLISQPSIVSHSLLGIHLFSYSLSSIICARPSLYLFYSIQRSCRVPSPCRGSSPRVCLSFLPVPPMSRPARCYCYSSPTP